MSDDSMVSIIIPAYNVEKYLGKCIDSVIHQTFQNLEIICVNDGSRDSSLYIMREYANELKQQLKSSGKFWYARTDEY